MIKKCFFLFLLPAAWLFFSVLLCWLSAEISHPLAFVKFHAFLSVYACFIWVLACQKDFWISFFRGFLAFGSGICLDFFLIKSVPGPKPYLFSLWFFLSIYLFFLLSLKKALQKISSWHSLFFVGFSLFFFGNIFFLKNLNNIGINILLYFHPLVLASLFFPGYDYIRGKFFYEIYPIASYVGIFRYPDKTIACIAYMSLGLLLYLFHTFFKKQVKQS